MFKWLYNKNDIEEPPYSYDFVMNMNEKDYPQYLKKYYKFKMGKNLNLKNPKTFNEKIQWLKLHDTTKLKIELTDKVLVRDWIKKQIGTDYLKPVLQICKNFNEINFEKLPTSFIIKANNGCKWHHIVKNKEKFLNSQKEFNETKNKFDGWMTQSLFGYTGFELQYKSIKPQILIEKLLIDDINDLPIEYEVFCTNGIPFMFQEIKYDFPPTCCVWNRKFEEARIRFNPKYIHKSTEIKESLKEAVDLSKTLSKEFVLVRVDWLVHNEKLYFNEMTFTPFSGFYRFPKEEADLFMGRMINLNTIKKGK